MDMARRIPLVVVILVLLTGAVGVASAAIQITTVDAPSTVTTGETVRVSATADADEDLDNEMVLSVFRMDTGEKLCEAHGGIPGMAMCSETFTMPTHDVTIKTVLRFETGGHIDTVTTTITAEQAATTPTETPEDIGGGGIVTEHPPRENGSTGTITPAPDPGDGDEDDGLVMTLIDGFTSGGKTEWSTVIADAFRTALFAPFLVLLQDLVKALAILLAWTPDVYPNPAVEEVHRETLSVGVMLSLLGFLAAGILYQIGPIVNVSYREARLILPRLVVALLFGAVSLPLLQLAVDLTNALTIAFKPELFEARIGETVGTATAVVLVWVIDAVLLVIVAAVYILRDVYILFVAAISPIVAVAWAVPKTHKYASSFIAGWWTALAMGPLAMLVLTFVFVLLDGKGVGPLQTVGNWLFGVAGFALLLFIPWQLYGASQAIVGQAYALMGQAETGLRHKYRRYRTDELDDLDQAVQEEYGVDLADRGAYARREYRDRYREDHGSREDRP